MQIRPYEERDKENFRNICIVTADCADKSEKEKQFILKLYCDYYIVQEPENCFALADKNDEAVGYILCSDDFNTYRKNITPYLKDIRKLSFHKYLYAKGEILAHLPASKKCKAHMHIDILPDYQHQGYGSQMITTLKKHLSEKNVDRLMLVVSSRNTNAVKFYKKNGFRPFIDFKTGILMILDL